MVNDFIRKTFSRPMIWGGLYSTLFPERCLEFADYVVCGEGEEAIVELLDTLQAKGDISGIQNLAYRDNDGYIFRKSRQP
jgi:radical SAM superfamily enzyme YgiQ (UPF0313 family)